MNLYYKRIKQFIPDINHRAHTLEDFWQIAQNHEELLVQSANLRKLLNRRKYGFYYCDRYKNHHVIVLHNNLTQWKLTITAFHELVNFFLHYDCDFLRRRQHISARVFALVLLMPENALPELLRNYESLDRYHKKLVTARIKNLHKYGY